MRLILICTAVYAVAAVISKQGIFSGYGHVGDNVVSEIE